jgi:hypothetical protein
MKAILCSVLALFQVLICTVGQGALTLCVRKDGTQQLEWSWATSCTDARPESTCHCGCSDDEKSCPDEMPYRGTDSSSVSRTCSSCTDHVLVAEQPSVTIEKNLSQLTVELHFLNLNSPVELVSNEFASMQQYGTDPPSLRADSFTAIACCVVIRC